VNVVRFCAGCNRQLRPEWGDGETLCLRCSAHRADAGPADPGAPVIGYAVWLVAFCVAAGAAWWVAAKILAGAGY
jgi:hypothetical protein